MIPKRAMEEQVLCAKSGLFPSEICPELDTSWLPEAPGRTRSCPFHERVHLSPDGQYRVTAECVPSSERRTEIRFVLPPSWEHYYRRRNPSYAPLPPYAPYCQEGGDGGDMVLIHPSTARSSHYLPIGLSGEKGELVFEASHRNDEAKLHWHLDDRYLGSTTSPHKMAFDVKRGEHLMTIVDGSGNTIEHPFEVMAREEG